MYVVMPAMSLMWGTIRRGWEEQGKPLPDGFRYASNTNPEWLTIEQIQRHGGSDRSRLSTGDA
jgi:UDP-N-acetylglucosamine 4,6-dehydratase/5-epimerase